MCFAFLWVPASAGMTGGAGGNDGGFTLTLGPPLNLPLGGGGRLLEGEGMYPVPPLCVPACAGMTGGWHGNDGGFTLTLGGEGRWFEGEGMYPVMV